MLPTQHAPAPPRAVASVGDILVSYWGWERTNVDFYQVVQVLPRSVRLRPIASRVVVRDRRGEHVVPAPDQFAPLDDGPPAGTMHRVRRSADHPAYSVRIRTPYKPRGAGLWNGEPVIRTPLDHLER